MNLDKAIKELTNRLDTVYPASSTTNGGISHDGIHYWKGKKIISAKDWNELYEKNSTYTDTYKTTLTSRKPLQYFPDEYNGSISSFKEELKEEIQQWNTEYYELLEFRKNPTLGRRKCSSCIFSGHLDDPLFVGIEKVIARIVSNQCNDNNAVNNRYDGIITYHCNVMNIFSCPFESTEESKYPYKREDLFTLHRISFAIEQAISTFFEITKQNEIIYEVDFLNDKVHEIHTKYTGEPESWGWQKNVKEQLSKVKPISNIVIKDENDIYSILTNREKLECLLQEYERYYQLDREAEQQQVCCDKNPPCVPNEEDDDSNNKKVITSSLTATTTEALASARKEQQQIQQQQEQKQDDYSHKGKNRHSKNTNEQSIGLEKELNNKNLQPDLKSKIKEELKKSYKEQLILLKQNKQIIIDFLLGNKDSIRIEDMKIYEPIYKCYRQKGNCHICNSPSNIICISCNKDVWLCINHWQNHRIEKHERYNKL
jgi:hypothetical protein